MTLSAPPVGPAPSGVTVNVFVAVPVATFVAVTVCEPAAATAPDQLYVVSYGEALSSPPPAAKPVNAGKLTFAMPDCASVVVAAIWKLPALPACGLMNAVVPVT